MAPKRRAGPSTSRKGIAASSAAPEKPTPDSTGLPAKEVPRRPRKRARLDPPEGTTGSYMISPYRTNDSLFQPALRIGPAT